MSRDVDRAITQLRVLSGLAELLAKDLGNMPASQVGKAEDERAAELLLHVDGVLASMKISPI